MAGLAEIAKELNVSSSLVSKVLNKRLGTTRVSAKTILAIETRAKHLNFRRNASASALATGRQNVVGLFLHRVGVEGSGIIDSLIRGISAEAAVHHKRLLIHFFESMDEFLEQRDLLQRSVMDGIILGGLHHKEMTQTLLDVQSNGMPVFTIFEIPLDDRIANIGMKQREIGHVATSHLIARGCKRIAQVNRMNERFEGYKDALAENNLPFDPELVVTVPTFQHTAGRQALEELLRRGVDFDGVFASSDQQAVGMMNALARLGRRIPQDIKIIGTDNSPFCNFTVVPLSSVSQAEFERGRLALRMLVEQAASPEAIQPRAVWFPPILCERESTQLLEVI